MSLLWIPCPSLFQYLIFELKCSVCLQKLTFMFKVWRTLVELPQWSGEFSVLFGFDLFVNKNGIMFQRRIMLSRVRVMDRLFLLRNNCTCMHTHTLAQTHKYIGREQIQIIVKICVSGILVNGWCVYYETKYFKGDMASEGVLNSKDIQLKLIISILLERKWS